jgi:1-acyl-sn-glycerol-3-phosphate acyltransferase
MLGAGLSRFRVCAKGWAIANIPAVSSAGWIVFGVVIWAAWVLYSRWLMDGPRENIEAGLLWRFIRRYARRLQRLRLEGLENRPSTRPGGPLVIVSNHMSGVDAVLVIASCPFEIRWIMAADMRAPLAAPFWDWTNVILVDRQKGDASGTREAVRHIKAGNVVGIFPEGGIEREPGKLMPFHGGVGLIVRRSGAPVLPVVIRGAARASTVWGSYLKKGNAVVEFKPWIRYDKSMSAEEIAADLQKRYQEWTGFEVGKGLW